uniref:WAP domain-containing protein n=1 Tax=Varanus komodoensis TaxID=61221 RepID=A0A8D2L7B7_VARKO
KITSFSAAVLHRMTLMQPGVCPRASATCSGGKVVDYCQGDDQCPNQRKCCLGPCGKACTQPEKGTVCVQLLTLSDWVVAEKKPKSCPLDATKCTTLADYECNNDSECKGTAKCCFSKCALRCVTPI